MDLGLVSLVGRVMSRHVFRGDCKLSATLGSLSDDGWCCVPTLLVVRLEVSQQWSLQAVGLARSHFQNGDLQERSYQWVFPGMSTTSVLAPQ